MTQGPAVVLQSSPWLFQRGEVSDQLIEFLVIQVHSGHQCSGFELVRCLDPGAQVFGRVLDDTGTKSIPAHKVGQVGAKSAGSNRPIKGMAVDASVSLEYAPPGINGRLTCSQCLLLLQPMGKFFRSVNIDPQQHPRMLGPAIFGALTQE